MDELTPGPWTVDPSIHGATIRAPDETVAEAICNAADAALIAAAPSLLGLLETMLDRLTDGRSEADSVTLAEWADEVEEAIAQARGDLRGAVSRGRAPR